VGFCTREWERKREAERRRERERSATHVTRLRVLKNGSIKVFPALFLLACRSVVIRHCVHTRTHTYTHTHTHTHIRTRELPGHRRCPVAVASVRIHSRMDSGKETLERPAPFLRRFLISMRDVHHVPHRCRVNRSPRFRALVAPLLFPSTPPNSGRERG